MPNILPPIDISIDLRTRFNIDTTTWIFSMYAPTEHQLDSALMRFNYRARVAEFEDAVGILVDGTVFVDDEPYWRNLLVSDATYDIVYLYRPIWQRGLWLWLWDMWMNTPLIMADDIPQRQPGYSTSEAYARLVGPGGTGQRPCECEHHAYWLWNTRNEEEMEEAKTSGRWIVYERMRRLNPARVKEE
ncbi:hypothetical protein Q9L58_009382 [Maublancomyces gigas]|uniref:Uncharacterized protein n=1 Tax=Discina gigas TaxID=1032678 RepID=A0ABR3G720_9PEZI